MPRRRNSSAKASVTPNGLRTGASWRRCAAAALFACAAPAGGEGVQRIGSVTHPALAEISGIVKSDRGDFYWVHNDSGHDAALFAIDAAGEPLLPPWLGVNAQDWQGHAIDHAANADWEAIALADGTLYIADVGNNGNARRDLGVYVVNEPDPRAVPRMKAFAYLPLRYPDQRGHPGDVWHFDCEAVFVADGRLHFITKHRRSRQIGAFEAGAKLYRLDTWHTNEENTLTLLGEHEDIRVVTGADISPDGSRLAVATYVALWIFERPEEGENWLAGRASRLDLPESLWQRQLEAIAWQDATSLLLVNERRDILRAKVADFSPVP